MIRISGINLPDNKRIVIALTYIFGVGKSSSEKILKGLKINMNAKTKDLTADEASRLREAIEKNFRVEGELKHEIKMNIRRLKEIGCYRGIRHQRGLPVRGQRTKTNNRTVRGNVRRTMTSGRKPSSEKT